ncbi:MAG TPA: Rdx family protein [Salinisphaeraceae bacterium]|nr:Rdx family protein [Salinisphaeraceae bacterium]
MTTRVEIHYCHSCGLLPRAVWMAQELLNSFEDRLGEIALLPAAAGVFEIRLDGERLHSRDHDGGFPEPRTMKQAIQARLC